MTNRSGRGGGVFTPNDRQTAQSPRAPANTVFEDVAPRLADITGDGQNEIIVVNSHPRWLAPIGIDDFNGDGDMDVAYVDRPHLTKTLRVWTYRKGSLTEIANQTGLSNHRIGDNYIMGGVRNCGGPPQMITSDATWTRIMSTQFENGHLVTRDIGPAKNRRSYTKALTC